VGKTIYGGAMKLAYCDKIAFHIKLAMENSYDFKAGDIGWDLHPAEGYLLSTKKTIIITDRNEKQYIITVEEK